MEAGPAGAEGPRSTCPAGQRRGWRWASTPDVTGWPGKWAPAQFLKGKLQRLTAPVVTSAASNLKDRILDGELALASPSMRAVARGALDLASNRYRGVRLGIDLTQPARCSPT